MTLDQIANYCEFKDCQVSAGDPEAGFIQIDGTGIQDRSYTYGRFHMLNEISSLPAPDSVVEKASVFRISRGESTRSLNREDFESEIKRFEALVG